MPAADSAAPKVPPEGTLAAGGMAGPSSTATGSTSAAAAVSAPSPGSAPSSASKPPAAGISDEARAQVERQLEAEASSSSRPRTRLTRLVEEVEAFRISGKEMKIRNEEKAKLQV